MNIETTKSELIEMIETIQNEEVLNRMKSQAQRLKEIDKNITESNYSIEEAELIDKIKEAVSKDDLTRHDDLYLKLLKEEITPEEHGELGKLIEVLENASAERLKYMIHLSRLWDTTVQDVMKRLNIKAPKYLNT